jgi:DNA-binding protein YbaB
VSESDHGQALLEARRDLEALRARGFSVRPAIDRSTTAGDGRLRVLVRDGRIAAIEVNRALLNLDPAALGGLVVNAVNSALTGTPDDDGRPDLDGLTDMLDAARAEALATIRAISSSIQDAISRIGPRSGMHGESGSLGLELLLGETLNILRAGTVDQPYAEATDPHEQVLVTIGPSRRLVTVRITPAAMRLSSAALAERLVAAINAALDATPVRPAEVQAQSRATAELSQRVRRIQDQSLEHMRAYTRSLTAIMYTVGEPE